MWGPKQEKVQKPWVLHLYCWIFSMQVSEEERSARDGVSNMWYITGSLSLFADQCDTIE